MESTRKRVALYLIDVFSPTKEEYLTRKTAATIAHMKSHKLFEYSDEYVNSVLAVFEPYGLSLMFLREITKNEDMTEYSVISRKQWEEIFPHIVVTIDKSILLK